MALTLADILSAPTDPDALKDHLRSSGVIPPAQPVQPIPPMGEALPSSIPTRAPTSPRDMKIMLGASANPEVPKPMAPLTMDPGPKFMQPSPDPALANAPAVPNFAPPTATPAPGAGLVQPLAPPTAPTKEASLAAGKTEYAANRPQVTAQPGTADFYREKLAQEQYDQAHPLGSAISANPTMLGKAEHVLGRVGNIAGDVLIPNLIGRIPGTEANKAAEMAQNTKLLGEAETRESQEAARKSAEQTAEVQRRNVESEIAHRDINQQSLEKDQAGNVIGWKDNAGIHSMNDPTTPPGIQKIAEEAKTAPRFETDKVTGNIVKLSTDAQGKTTSEVVYKGTPNQKLETRSVLAPDGHAHEQIFDVTPGSPNLGNMVKDLGRSKEDKPVSVSQELAKITAGEKIVSGFDKNGQAVIGPKSQADEEGWTHVAQGTTKEVDDAKQNYAALNDMGAKIQNMLTSAKVLDKDPIQKTLIQEALKSDPDSWTNRLAMSQMSDEAKAYVQDVRSLREAALALPKQTTGGSRVSEPQAKALWATIPSAAGSAKDAENALRKFDENLGRLWKKVPGVEGQTRERPFGESTAPGGGEGGGGKVATMQNVQDYATKHNISVDAAKKFFTDAHYKVQ